jgi:hypothetical protein
MRQISIKGILVVSFALIQFAIVGWARAEPSCTTSKYKAAERAMNKMLAVMIENAPVECRILPAGDGKRCGIVCLTAYAMTDSQRQVALVMIVGASGIQINKVGVSNFSSIMYADRTTGDGGYGYEISAQEAARIQSFAHADKMSAEEVVAAVMRAAKVHSANKH